MFKRATHKRRLTNKQRLVSAESGDEGQHLSNSYSGDHTEQLNTSSETNKTHTYKQAHCLQSLSTSIKMGFTQYRKAAVDGSAH